jgi:hypothetical protein
MFTKTHHENILTQLRHGYNWWFERNGFAYLTDLIRLFADRLRDNVSKQVKLAQDFAESIRIPLYG